MTNALHNECKKCYLFVILVLICSCGLTLLMQSLTNLNQPTLISILTKNKGASIACCSDVDCKEDCQVKTQPFQLESKTDSKVGKWLPGKVYKQTPCKHGHFHGCCNALGE